jgi:hypothetical protein
MLALVEVGNSGEMATIASLAAGGVVMAWEQSGYQASYLNLRVDQLVEFQSSELVLQSEPEAAYVEACQVAAKEGEMRRPAKRSRRGKRPGSRFRSGAHAQN